MGKKANWSVAEDQALCRAWLSAGDAMAHTHAPDAAAAPGNARASTFWGVVSQRFHAELVTAVDRPHNGVKIRWTRINRDVQKFAVIFQQLQASRGGCGGDGDEQQSIEAAKELYFRQHDGKFLFEACWQLLRYSPKWTQLLANGVGVDVATKVLPPASSTTSAMLERSSPIQQLQEVTSCLVDEMKRRNELLEEQNAIALFRLETDDLDDDLAREYAELLRRKYAKRMRAALGLGVQANGNSGCQPSDRLDESAAARDTRATGDAVDTESDTEGENSDRPRRQLLGSAESAEATAAAAAHRRATGIRHQ
ncbi:hypothetical protein PybrP1_011443 [[Pythium] brassicae (nom. inval.)]|nr:hypothetical protein PybrP1_011443 [[Pythium] brassicae (nom. inval.)]